jgi:hypothetical protein
MLLLWLLALHTNIQKFTFNQLKTENNLKYIQGLSL